MCHNPKLAPFSYHYQNQVLHVQVTVHYQRAEPPESLIMFHPSQHHCRHYRIGLEMKVQKSIPLEATE